MSVEDVPEACVEAAEAIEQVSISSQPNAESSSTAGSGSATISTTSSVSDTSTRKSALEDNIAQKGKNAYYFAHAHKANGPKWDGKAEPRLLSSRSLSGDELKMKISSFEYQKSNITSYAFSDEGKYVKLYITMEEVGDKCSDEDVTLDYTQSSFSLQVRNYKDEPQFLSFGKLTANISGATYKKKKDKIIVVLTKENEGEWYTINDKGAPDHELV